MVCSSLSPVFLTVSMKNIMLCYPMYLHVYCAGFTRIPRYVTHRKDRTKTTPGYIFLHSTCAWLLEARSKMLMHRYSALQRKNLKKKQLVIRRTLTCDVEVCFWNKISLNKLKIFLIFSSWLEGLF